MNLLVDENLPHSIVESARHGGHDTAWVRDEMPGAPDADILKRLADSGETLVTRDIRFANLVLSQIVSGRPLGGVVLIRAQRIAEINLAWNRWLEAPRSPRGIVVLTPTKTRYRESPADRRNG